MQISEVLRLFDSPLSQEQCWSICFGLCKTLARKRREDDKRKENIRYILSLDSLILTQRGDIEILHSEPNLTEQQEDKELIFATGNLICRCLDYGLNEIDICEVHFQDDLAELIGGMVLQNNEFDEGIGGDTDSLSESWQSQKLAHYRNFKTLKEVLRFCEARLLRKNIDRREKHYNSISKALYLEASELKAFLGHVLHELNVDKKETTEIKNSPELAKTYVRGWAKLWLKVMDELRSKTRERKILNEETSAPETHYYKCTPFDLDSQVELQATGGVDIPETLPEDAEEKIFTFLRSRVSSQEDIQYHRESSFEDSIDNSFNQSFEPTTTFGKDNAEISTETLNNSEKDLDKVQPNCKNSFNKPEIERKLSEKKILQVPDGLVRKISNWRKDDTLEQEFLEGYYASDDDYSLKDSICTPRSSTSSGESLRGEKSITNQDLFDDIFGDSMNTYSPRRNTISTMPSKGRLSQSEMCLHKIDINDTNECEENIEKVGSSLTEIFKIRQELVRAEQQCCGDNEVTHGKKCFGCRKNKFSFFQRAQLCAVCKKKYCLKCVKTNVPVPSSLSDAMPVNIDVTHHEKPSGRNMVRSKSLINVSEFNNRVQLPWQHHPKLKGVKLNMCSDCHIFVESIKNEKRKSEWTVQLEMDL